LQGVFEAAAAPAAHDNDSSREQVPVELPPAPDAAAAAEAQRRACEAAAARVAYEEDQAVLRSLRMVLRGIVQRALTVKRSAYALAARGHCVLMQQLTWWYCCHRDILAVTWSRSGPD
jgi:hypothetical protein